MSLGTRNFRTAEYLADLLSAAFEELTANSMTSPDLQGILRDYLRASLARARSKLLKTPYGEAAFNSSSRLYDFPEEADEAAAKHMVAQFKDDLRRRDARSIETVMRQLADAHNVPDEQRRELSLGMLQAQLQVQEQILVWLKDGITTVIDTKQPVPPSMEAIVVPSPVAPAGPLLSELLPGFLDLMTTAAGWRGQTTAQNKATYRMFLEVCGDRPMAWYQRRDLSQFYETLRLLPALYSKKTEWRELSLSEIGLQTKELDLERLTMKTIKRHFAALGRLFDHFKRHGEYEGDNPAYGFEYPATKGRANQDRDMWHGEDLTRLFASPVWAGCKSAARRSLPGSLIIKDEKYWLPILGLYHGNRLEEFAQLQREDVKQKDGIWYFDINDDELKQIKNAQSRREVPIHPQVKALGFLDYVNSVAPNAGDHVFPELMPGGPDDKLGYYFTKWWSQYRRAVGVYSKKLNYHSFRHGVTTKLFAAEVTDAFVDTLTGHEGKTTSRRVYLKALPIAALYDAISKVEWPEC